MSDDSNISTLPVDVDFDLDAAERPEKDVKEPFKVRVGGRVVVFGDPEEVDWKDLLDIESPVDFLRHSVSESDRIHIIGQDMPGWKLAQLMERYQQHYGFEDKVAEARRRAKIQGLR